MKRIVTFGEIMLRLAPPGFLRFIQAHSFEAIYGGGGSKLITAQAVKDRDYDGIGIKTSECIAWNKKARAK